MSGAAPLSSALFADSAEYLAALEQAEAARVLPPATPAAQEAEPLAACAPNCLSPEAAHAQVGVLQLINAYRFHGFRAADIDPLRLHPQPEARELDPAEYGLTAADLDKTFDTGSLAGPQRDTLRAIVARLERAYRGTLSAEYMHLTDTARKRWLQAHLEPDCAQAPPDAPTRRWLLAQLAAAETLERTLHTRYVGQKRFSLEGEEALIPLLNRLVQRAAAVGVREIGLGMAHRGRLNVIHNVLGHSVIALFEHTLHGKHDPARGGDVKYHQGVSAHVVVESAQMRGEVRVTLAFNPSHLEIVNPVVEGWARARQQALEDHAGELVMPVLIHGDAAIAGQGVVMETLNMAATRGFSTGGTIHVVLNNQIGFTTSDPRDARSSLYCTDVMKIVEAPVLHVNADDPEAVLRAIDLALEYRMTWRQDIAINLVGYRRLGHNEQDDPMVTQPLMYQRIHARPSAFALYAERLAREGVMDEAAVRAVVEAYRDSLDATPQAPRPAAEPEPWRQVSSWANFRQKHWRKAVRTAIPASRLRALSRRLVDIPDGFVLHPRVQKILQDRAAMGEGRLPLDWGMAETLAYATLLSDGIPVRLTGQDSGRGTFFHRHAVLHDQHRGAWDAGIHIPLQHLVPGQADFIVVDSLLSEEAVLGFEYGYAGADPDQLVVWEAQFGDFANGAQVVIDQFIAAAETKWGLLNGLVMFLPHGYEGQGPEHSSGRIERFLQLAARDNIQITQPSTPAQIFHLLRRQIVRPYRKPLIVFTPKSLLRHAEAVSVLDEFTRGHFNPVLDDPRATVSGGLKSEDITRLVFCSGRLYYDLMQACRQAESRHIAIIRIEQLYPVPDEEIRAVIQRYPNVKAITWAQDEPQNQGAWRFIAYQIRMQSGIWLDYAGRAESASPATGISSLHKRELESILNAALNG